MASVISLAIACYLLLIGLRLINLDFGQASTLRSFIDAQQMGNNRRTRMTAARGRWGEEDRCPLI